MVQMYDKKTIKNNSLRELFKNKTDCKRLVYSLFLLFIDYS